MTPQTVTVVHSLVLPAAVATTRSFITTTLIVTINGSSLPSFADLKLSCASRISERIRRLHRKPANATNHFLGDEIDHRSWRARSTNRTLFAGSTFTR